MAEKVVADEKVLARANCLQWELWSFMFARLIDKKCVGAVGATWEQPLQTELLEKWRSHIDIDKTRSDQVDAFQAIPFLYNHLVFSEMYELHTVTDLFDQIIWGY